MKNLINGHTHIQCKDYPGFKEAVVDAKIKRHATLLSSIGKVVVHIKRLANPTVYHYVTSDERAEELHKVRFSL